MRRYGRRRRLLRRPRQNPYWHLDSRITVRGYDDDGQRVYVDGRRVLTAWLDSAPMYPSVPSCSLRIERQFGLEGLFFVIEWGKDRQTPVATPLVKGFAVTVPRVELPPT